MSDAIPHPRETFSWLGAGAHEQAFLGALERGRLHHAWLLSGPRGVGKATFAYRAARRLLGATKAPEFGLLGATPADPVSRQIQARAHPDLLVLQRDAEDGKSRRNIPVEEARGLSEFFSKTPAAAPYRVAIVDMADDLNAGSANALLKTLEEPPPRGVILLLTAAPGGLLATIRSRCRRLSVAPPEGDLAGPWVAERTGLAATDAVRLLAMARGAPGEAWRLGEAGALEVEAKAARLIAALPKSDLETELALADSFRGAAGGARFQLLFNCLADLIQGRVVAAARAGEAGSRVDAWARAWSDLLDLKFRVEAVNLDRSEALGVALSRLRAIA